MAHGSSEVSHWLVDDRITSYAAAGCITIVGGMARNEVLAKLGADAGRPVSLSDVRHDEGLNWVSVAGPEDGLPDSTTVVIEDNGWEGVRSEVLEQLSKRGKAAAVFWNVNGVVRFACASRGKVKTTVELPDPEVVDDLPAALRRVLQSVPTDSQPVAIAMAMAERFTGVAVPLISPVTTPTEAYPITAPILGLRVTGPELLGLKYPNEEIVEAVRAASPEKRRGLAAWATRRALDRAVLTDQPQLASMLSQLELRNATRFTAEASAFRTVADRNSNAADYALSVEGDHDRAKGLEHWHAKSWAMEALAYTAASDDITAALGATYCASIPYGLGSTDYERFLSDALAALDA